MTRQTARGTAFNFALCGSQQVCIVLLPCFDGSNQYRAAHEPGNSDDTNDA